MKKPHEVVEMKLKSADVRLAVEMFLNSGQYGQDELKVKSIRKTRSKNWFMVVRVGPAQ